MTNQQLIKETSDTIDEYLPKLQKGIVNMCDYFRKGAEKEGLHLLPTVIEGIDWIIKAVQGLNNIRDNKLPEFSDISVTISEMLDAFEKKDFILLTDLFEYEINPFLESIEIANK